MKTKLILLTQIVKRTKNTMKKNLETKESKLFLKTKTEKTSNTILHNKCADRHSFSTIKFYLIISIK